MQLAKKMRLPRSEELCGPEAWGRRSRPDRQHADLRRRWRGARTSRHHRRPGRRQGPRGQRRGIAELLGITINCVELMSAASSGPLEWGCEAATPHAGPPGRGRPEPQRLHAGRRSRTSIWRRSRSLERHRVFVEERGRRAGLLADGGPAQSDRRAAACEDPAFVVRGRHSAALPPGSGLAGRDPARDYVIEAKPGGASRASARRPGRRPA